MFFLFLILLILFLANKDSVRQTCLNRDLAALRREKMEAVIAARRAQIRIDQIEAVRALPVAEEKAVYIGLLPLKDYAEGVGLKADTVRRQCVRGTLPGAVKIGRGWYVPANALYADTVPAAAVISSGRPVQVIIGGNAVCSTAPSANEADSLTLPSVRPAVKDEDFPAREMTADSYVRIIN